MFLLKTRVLYVERIKTTTHSRQYLWVYKIYTPEYFISTGAEYFISTDNDRSAEIGNDFIEFESDLANLIDINSDQSEKKNG